MNPTATDTKTSGAFPTTHWSTVLDAGVASESVSQAALEALCRRYWYPLYAFARRQGRTHADAEDATQEFFARLLSNTAIAQARRERGRFRTFLLTAFRHFLINEWRRSQAVRRGGACHILPLDYASASRTYEREPADPGLTPERAFDRSWARGLMEEAVATLRQEYERTGRGELFRVLAPMLWTARRDDPMTTWAAQLGLGEHALTMALHRLRARFGERLRSTVAETVASPDQVDDELRYLIAVVAG